MIVSAMRYRDRNEHFRLSNAEVLTLPLANTAMFGGFLLVPGRANKMMVPHWAIMAYSDIGNVSIDDGSIQDPSEIFICNESFDLELSGVWKDSGRSLNWNLTGFFADNSGAFTESFPFQAWAAGGPTHRDLFTPVEEGATGVNTLVDQLEGFGIMLFFANPYSGPPQNLTGGDASNYLDIYLHFWEIQL